MPAQHENRTENRQRLMEIVEVVRRHEIIKDAIRENVTLHVVTPEETCGEENDEEESADDTADFVMDAVDSLNDEQLAALKARIAEREKAAGEKTDESEKTEE